MAKGKGIPAYVPVSNLGRFFLPRISLRQPLRCRCFGRQLYTPFLVKKAAYPTKKWYVAKYKSGKTLDSSKVVEKGNPSASVKRAFQVYPYIPANPVPDDHAVISLSP
mmetsp:Transcript_13288/g.23851  ORF Transcript_13288/g.23851 Transcript_13288/m.23851 type:complete len:108 (+) Transcript_13288:2661-2984(+)